VPWRGRSATSGSAFAEQLLFYQSCPQCVFFPDCGWNTWIRNADDCYEFSVVVRSLILTSSSSYAQKVGFISPDRRHLDLNSSPLTFFVGNGKRLIALGLVHVTCFKLLAVPSLLIEFKVVQLYRSLHWTGAL